MLLGIISDTHGLLRPEAEEALRGVELIIHAGDIGHPDVLAELKRIAPVFAVKGNVDTAPWAQELPPTTVVEAGAATCSKWRARGDSNSRPLAPEASALSS
jgi:uncharacterized protein